MLLVSPFVSGETEAAQPGACQDRSPRVPCDGSHGHFDAPLRTRETATPSPRGAGCAQMCDCQEGTVRDE